MIRDHAARIKHDLGKYVAFQARWLPDDPADDELREALVADLLSTRRGPDGSMDALQVWDAFRAPLVGDEPLEEVSVDLSEHRAFVELDQSMTALRVHVEALRAGEDIDLGLARAQALCVAQACTAFLNTFRELS
ncbi:MAG: hypothetical protein KC912_00320 [Proteobacteria bacterium]|nr:hypothetical protein [Pseudomonadota bacterium]